MPIRPSDISLEPSLRRQAAVDLFNYTWTMLEKPERTAGETERMIHAAHASRYFWEDAGGPLEHARGEWQLARVYAVGGRGEPALHHARRCLALCEEHGIGDFDLAFAHEAMARAAAVAGNRQAAADHARLAREAAAAIAGDDDRETVLADLATLP